ncbi:hypothetical protein AZI86_05920 [Bdellovibrio bacteriovorus]|uniref:TonB C-terminal domain-containing protein n=1 Tax=Bdellovibrio bacteriovorus TaxID=959 RepID=A0A150WQ08_BDEBC|nr:energy transducer TonB [Bdellovibrio bacteriovorus]KYG66581.1 hypothetical protein AZI86_05920 [Bdellovibrio bacteriovorus]
MGNNDKNYSTSVADYELWALAHREKEPSKAPRFVTLSAAAHLSALIVVALFATPLVNEIKPETITIEIEDVNPPMVSKGLDVPATQGSSAPVTEELPKLAEKISVDDIVAPTVAEVPKELPAKVVVPPAQALPEKVVAAKAPKAAAAKPVAAAKSVAPKTNFKAVPATIDDIEAPELDKGDFAKTPVASDDLGDDLNNDFAKVDQKNADELENEKRNMDHMAAALASEQDESLKGLAQDNEEEQERLNAAQEALRQKNADAVAAALASEQAEANAAAQREAARQAAAAREAAARKARADAEAQALAGQGVGQNQGKGAGNNGDPNQASAALAGAPTGIRSLDQLRQMPGNPRPQYDREERRRGDQGEVAFAAYISKEGVPTQFRMMKSTGFRNLDGKTLAALKKWRFYPGQEGWVELPFRWDLKGGVQEDGGLLRRAVSSN